VQVRQLLDADEVLGGRLISRSFTGVGVELKRRSCSQFEDDPIATAEDSSMLTRHILTG
jgi:hypothetical protein